MNQWILGICTYVLLGQMAIAQTFDWAINYGGEGFDDVRAMAIDEMGNLYIAGKFDEIVNFDRGDGITELDAKGSTDTYILKMDGEGNLLWVRHLDGSPDSENLCAAMDLDSEGNVVVVGEFTDQSDFNPAGSGATINALGRDGYIVKYSPEGDFIWVKHIKGSGENKILSVTIDQDDNIYHTGVFRNVQDFDPGDEQMEIASKGHEDIYLQKLDKEGNLVWVNTFGSEDGERGQYIKAHGEFLYCTGYFKNQIDFDPGLSNSIMESRDGSSDIFMLKLTLDGDHIWARSFGGESIDEGIVIALDSEENVILGGDYLSTVYFSEDNSISFPNIIGAGFLMKLSPQGDLLWVKAVKEHNSLALDEQDNIYTVGQFRRPFDFDPGPGEVILEGLNGTNSYLQKFNSDGEYAWVKQFEKINGSGTNEINSVILDQDESIYLAGQFWETVDFDPSDVSYELTSNKWSDGFVVKLAATISATQSNFLNDQLDVFPNPFTSHLTLESSARLSPSKMVLLDQLGRTIIEQQIDFIGHKQIQLAANLPSGIYYLKICNQSGYGTYKLIKE